MTHREWEAIRGPPTHVEQNFINMIENNLMERKHISNIIQFNSVLFI